MQPEPDHDTSRTATGTTDSPSSPASLIDFPPPDTSRTYDALDLKTPLTVAIRSDLAHPWLCVIVINSLQLLAESLSPA